MENPRILIVEDERIIAEDLHVTLDNLNYNVCDIVSSGEEALKKTEKLKPDLILMDIVLKGKMNGIEAASIIHSNYSVPVVYLTAYADDSTLKTAKITEPYGYIVKPFEDNLLKSNIEMALYKHSMEQKLKKSEKQFREFFENSVTGMYRTSDADEILMANPALVQMLGYESEADLKKNNIETSEHYKKYDRTRFKKLMKEKQQVRNLEAIWLKKGMTPIYIRENAREVRDVDGNMLYYEGTVEDITERKKFEDELLKKQKLESLGVLAGGIAHDFNNILTSIIGYISLVKIYLSPDDKPYKMLENAEESSIRAKDLTQQLLTFSKGGVPIKKKTYIGNLLQESTNFALRGSNVQCRFTIAKNLYPTEIDEGQIRQGSP